MPNKNTEPLIVIHNPNSTNARRVEAEVFAPLTAARIPFDIYQTQFPDTEQNIADMAQRIPDNARILSAAGDGTAEQVANASIRGRKALTIGFLPYGNFNDLAHAHADLNQPIDETVLAMADGSAPVVETTPLTVEVNGNYWRHAESYVTIGNTALIANGFEDEISRSKLKQATPMQQNLIRYRQAGKDYFTNLFRTLPDFRVNDGPLLRYKTDLAFSNNPVAAGMVRSQDTYYDKSYYGERTNLALYNPLDVALFGIPSLLNHAPLNRAEDIRILFEKAAKQLPIQTGGEYAELGDVEELRVYKNPEEVLRVIHLKPLVN